MTPTGEGCSHSVVVRALDGEHGAWAANLHRQVLPRGLFPQLGPGFVHRYHASFGHSPYGVALVASIDGRPVGLLVGTTDDHAHYRWVMRHEAWRLAIAGSLALACRPRLLAHFVRTRARRYLAGVVRLARRSPRTLPTAALQLERERSGSLSHVAVSGEHQQSGVGAALVEALLDVAEAAGTTVLRVVTSRDEAGVSGFYRQLGWEPAGTTFDLDGKPYERLLCRLPGSG